jgi:hypothetical protein
MQLSGWRRSNEPDGAPELMTQILAVECHESGCLIAQPNCRLDNAQVVWSGARLASRTSRKRTRMCLLVRRPGTIDLAVATDVVVAYLPADLRMGDVLALPSRLPATVEAPRTQR